MWLITYVHASRVHDLRVHRTGVAEDTKAGESGATVQHTLVYCPRYSLHTVDMSSSLLWKHHCTPTAMFPMINATVQQACARHCSSDSQRVQNNKSLQIGAQTSTIMEHVRIKTHTPCLKVLLCPDVV